LPTSEYTAYSENKGKKLAFCLNKEKHNNNHLIDENTLMFVALHELSHIATESIGHNKEFWDNFKFLLKEAQDAGLYNMVDYSKENTEYCGMTITDNPYFE
jgi:predicted metal-dependent hydrolase